MFIKSLSERINIGNNRVLTAALVNRTAILLDQFSTPSHITQARAATFYVTVAAVAAMRGLRTPFPACGPLEVKKLFFTVLSDKLCMNRDRAHR